MSTVRKDAVVITECDTPLPRREILGPGGMRIPTLTDASKPKPRPKSPKRDTLQILEEEMKDVRERLVQVETTMEGIKNDVSAVRDDVRNMNNTLATALTEHQRALTTSMDRQQRNMTIVILVAFALVGASVGISSALKVFGNDVAITAPMSGTQGAIESDTGKP